MEFGRAIVEIPAPGAVARFYWSFDENESSTKITQRLTFEGEASSFYAETVGPGLKAGIPVGMAKLCLTITEAK